MNPLVSSLFMPVIGVSLVGCQFVDPDAQISLPSSGGNPLDFVGSSDVVNVGGSMESADGAYHVGDYVEVAQPQTALYAQYPQRGGRVKMKLDQGVVLNVLGIRGEFMHVQNEQGDEGFVSAMTVVPQGLLVADLPLDDGDVAIAGE